MRAPTALLLVLLAGGCAGGTPAGSAGAPPAPDGGPPLALPDHPMAFTLPGGAQITLHQMPDRPNALVVSAPAELVWKGLPGAYDRLGLMMTGLEPDTRRVGTDRVTLHGRLGGERLSRYVYCGVGNLGTALADQYTVSLQVISQVRPVEGASSAELTTVVLATATAEGVSAQHLDCSSTGALEEEIARIAVLVGSGVGSAK